MLIFSAAQIYLDEPLLSTPDVQQLVALCAVADTLIERVQKVPSSAPSFDVGILEQIEKLCKEVAPHKHAQVSSMPFRTHRSRALFSAFWGVFHRNLRVSAHRKRNACYFAQLFRPHFKTWACSTHFPTWRKLSAGKGSQRWCRRTQVGFTEHEIPCLSVDSVSVAVRTVCRSIRLACGHLSADVHISTLSIYACLHVCRC